MSRTVLGDGPVADALRADDGAAPNEFFLLSPKDAPTLSNQVQAAVDRGAGVVVVVVDHTPDPLDRHLILASIEPLARRIAPGGRIVAIDAGAAAAPGDVVAAALFLAGADAITGQILGVGRSA